MNAKDTLDIISGLKSAGATHFKSADFEVTFSPGSIQVIDTFPSERSGDDGITPAPQGQTQDMSAVHNVEATAKIQDLIKTLSMPNEHLVDKIFPNGAGG